MKKFFKKLLAQREAMLFLVVLAVFIFLSCATDKFLTASNLKAILISLAVETIIAVPMTNLLISGGFDMSVGSVVCFSGMVSAMLWKNLGVNAIVSILVGIVGGGAIGLLNGLLIAYVNIPAFVATLATMNISRGLVYALCQGRSIAGLPDQFTVLGQTNVLGIQLPIIFAIVLVIAGDLLLRKSKYFRQSFFVGGNEKSALLSGIKVKKFRLMSYFLTGLFAGFAGIVQAGRLGAAMATTGDGLEMKVLTAVIIGGASLAGGEGTVLGAFLGSILIATVTNAVNLLGVNVYWQTFITGMTLLIAVLIDCFGKSKKSVAAKEKKAAKKAE